MQVDILFTSSFTLPECLVKNLPYTSLFMGPDGIFGFGGCIDPAPYATETGTQDIPSREVFLDYYFLLYDIHKNEITETIVPLNYYTSFNMNVLYDFINSVWVIGINAWDMNITSNPAVYPARAIDFYEVGGKNEAYNSWKLVTRILTPTEKVIDDLNREVDMAEDSGKFLCHFWQYQDSFSCLIFGDYDMGSMTERYFYLAQWREYKQSRRNALDIGFLYATYVFNNSLLLVIYQCPSDIKTWQVKIGAYDLSGQQISQTYLPTISFPSRRDYWFADDLWDWLQPSTYIVPGPFHGSEKKQTCVAALQLREQQKENRRKNTPPYPKSGLPEFQGGLYHIDHKGQNLRYDPVRLGEQLSMCFCKDKIIGTDHMDGYWRLWQWSPLQPGLQTINISLAQSAERVTLLAANDYEESFYFWCIEEYITGIGIRVSLCNAKNFEILHQKSIEEIKLPNNPDGSGTVKTHCMRAYQNILLIMVIDQQRKLQLLKFHPNLDFE